MFKKKQNITNQNKKRLRRHGFHFVGQRLEVIEIDVPKPSHQRGPGFRKMLVKLERDAGDRASVGGADCRRLSYSMGNV